MSLWVLTKQNSRHASRSSKGKNSIQSPLTCNRGTQAFPKPTKKYFRSKGVMVNSKYKGINKGVMTKPQVKDAWTQWDQAETSAEPEPIKACRQLHLSHTEDHQKEDDMDQNVDMDDDNVEDVADEEEDLRKDPDYDPAKEMDVPDNKPRRILVTDIECQDEPVLPHIEPKYLVFESALLELFKICPCCCGDCGANIAYTKGTLVVVQQQCNDRGCDYSRKWYSQPFMCNTPAGNILLSAGILFNGASPTSVLKVLRSINVACIAFSTYAEHQRTYLQPAVVSVWERSQAAMIDQLQESGQPLIIGGDARNDSPGHTAKYGSYTFMELNLNKVLHLELVQKNEVANSYRMEMEGLKRGLEWMDTMELVLDTIITDRHSEVTAWVRENLTKIHGIKHYFDVWHITKGIKKKLRAVAAKKDCGDIYTWIRSITNHIYWVAASTPDGNPDVMAAKFRSCSSHLMNIHQHEDELFPACLHGPLEETDRTAWLLPDTKAADAVAGILDSPYLLRSIKKMSPLQQTSGVEAFHGVINYFAPKLLAYSYKSMLCRLYLAAMHYNENAGRAQRMKKDGELQWSICWPRGKDGDYVMRAVRVAPTYGYVHDLLVQATEYVMTGKKNIVTSIPALMNIPPPLADSNERPSLEAAKAREATRFAAAAKQNAPI